MTEAFLWHDNHPLHWCISLNLTCNGGAVEQPPFNICLLIPVSVKLLTMLIYLLFLRVLDVAIGRVLCYPLLILFFPFPRLSDIYRLVDLKNSR